MRVRYVFSRGAGSLSSPSLLLTGLVVFAATMIFGASAATAATPTVTIDPTVTAGYTAAHVTGTVDPHGEEVTVYAEYAIQPDGPFRFQLVEHIPAGTSGATPISFEVTGLEPNTEYSFRLDAEDIAHVETYSPLPNPTAKTKAVEVSPAVSIEPAEDVHATTAHLTGHINPNAPEPAPTSDDVEAAFGVDWHFECTPACPGLAGGYVPAGEAAQLVEADASGLEPGEDYEVELIAENAGGAATRATSGPEHFVTLAVPPEVSHPSASGTSATGATLNAQVNPGGAPTTYRFEYLTKAQYEAAGGFAGPDLRSTPGSLVGFSDNEFHPVEAPVTGLEPGATYYFRAVISNTSPGEPTVYSQARSFIAYAGPAAEPQNCSNEQLRSENNSLALPDCRAYEQVTPPYKQSHEIYLSGAISPDGSAVIAQSPGAFAGTEDVPRGPGSSLGVATYRFDRASTGWQTTPLDPSAADIIGNGGNNAGIWPTVDAKELVFVLQTKNSNAEEFYLRRSDGSFKLLSPLQDPATVNPSLSRNFEMPAASADDSVVLFYLKEMNGRWPGDVTTEKSIWSLYATDGSAEPKLVGVSNTGRLQSNSEANLITDCGIRLARDHEGRPNALSTSGTFAYFVAEPLNGFCSFGPEVEELYVRVAGEKTIPISEPTLPPGQECTGPCAAAEAEPAEFQGATEDGRKVFFSSAQPLLNADHDETTDLYEAQIVGDGTEATLGSLTLVSEGGAGDSQPGEGAEVLGVLAFSRSGSRVYFAAEGVLTSTPNKAGEKPQPGLPNLYSVNTASGATTFIATLEPQDESWLGGRGFWAQATPDGRYLVFSSTGDLTPDDTSSARQLFEYDAQNETLVRVSAGDRGYNNDGNTEFGNAFLASTEGRPSRQIADDGTVVFTSPIALTPGATSDPDFNVTNIYEFRAGRVSLVAPGVGANAGNAEPTASATRLWGIDPSGENIFFTTLAQLTPTDTDGRPDLYDARVGGGFQAPAVAASCAASASCQGPPSSPPGFSPPATATFSGPPDKKKHHKKKHHKKKHHKKKQGGSSKQRGTGK